MPGPFRLGIARPLRIRDFRLLWTGMFVSMAGDGFYYVAVAWQVYALSDRPGSLALVGIAWSLPQVLLVLLTGVLADRIDRRRLPAIWCAPSRSAASDTSRSPVA